MPDLTTPDGKPNFLAIARLLAEKAKELTNGMQMRVNRNPDVADYCECFTRAIREAYNR